MINSLCNIKISISQSQLLHVTLLIIYFQVNDWYKLVESRKQYDVIFNNIIHTVSDIDTMYLFKVIKLNKKFNIYPCHCCFISEFFLCSYLFHYISEDRIIYLCISDDVSYKTFQKVKLQEIIFNFKTYIFVKNFLKRICGCNILKTLLLKKYLIDYQVKLPN